MKIVSLGGGTGLSSLLKGLKQYVRDEWDDKDLLDAVLSKSTGRPQAVITDLSAVVTVSDDGGSSGRLRRDFRVVAPGDIRSCMVALSEDEALLSRLFQFRFSAGRGLKGHNFGNLFLTALAGVTGDFQEAVKVCSEVLAIRGHIYPSTMSNVTLEATLEDGTIVKGESNISHSRRRISRIRLVPANCKPLPQTLQAIREADVITLGPGSLFTSLIPNLLVRGVVDEISRSRAVKIYIANLMTQPGETSRFTAADHVRAIYEHSGVRMFDHILVNTAPISPATRKRYLARNSRPVEVDRAALEKLGVRVVESDLVSEKKLVASAASGKVRHDSDRLARAVMDLACYHQSWIREHRRGPERYRAAK